MRHSPPLAPDAVRPTLQVLLIRSGDWALAPPPRFFSCTMFPDRADDDEAPRHRPLDPFGA
ncbi:hypothetical protein C8R45DRAFT_1109554 [Mycena sanguinolenta]|nr:hypothetical protein C8R45DRAFT_1109554 [Mycena sanguinolenta]